MRYNNIMPYYPNNMYRSPYNRRDDRLLGPGGFLFPFALGFISSPLVYSATRPRPYGPFYGPPPVYRPYPYY